MLPGGRWSAWLKTKWIIRCGTSFFVIATAPGCPRSLHRSPHLLGCGPNVERLFEDLYGLERGKDEDDQPVARIVRISDDAASL